MIVFVCRRNLFFHKIKYLVLVAALTFILFYANQSWSICRKKFRFFLASFTSDFPLSFETCYFSFNVWKVAIISTSRIATIIETRPSLTGIIKATLTWPFVHTSKLRQLREDEKINSKRCLLNYRFGKLFFATARTFCCLKTHTLDKNNFNRLFFMPRF